MGDHLRIDKWLWQARFFKSRSLAAKLLAQKGVRFNGVRVSKPSRQVGVGDVLTFALSKSVKVVKVLAMGTRRGPAVEARALYEDLSAPMSLRANKRAGGVSSSACGQRDLGSGRPTKAQRRAFDRLRGRFAGE